MRVGSLFAGIGGFDLGLERAGFEIAWQVEIDPYAQRVLAKYWPTVQRYTDIRAVDWQSVPRVDLLCGGFPCQDLSYAGKRAGIDGERSGLWSEYVTAIRALRPRYIVVENVPGLLTNEYMGRVLRDLAQSGYNAEWDCIPASAFGAPHRRDRVWIVANAQSEHRRDEPKDVEDGFGRDSRSKSDESSQDPKSLANTASAGQDQVLRPRGRVSREPGRSSWLANSWPTEPAVGRVADGIPKRVDRLHGLGNAIVPQIAEWIGRQIMRHASANQ